MKSGWLRLRPKVLRRIRPSARLTSGAKAAARKLGAAARKAARARDQATRPLLVGSLAKGTHLSPNPDVDLFLLFPTDLQRDKLERVGLEVGQEILRNPQLRYAEHPYVSGRYGGFRFDVVPAYDVAEASERMSAVDRTPFHSEYVRTRLKPRQRDEVRILKRFLQGIGCYGAETAVGGFSGYLAELLVLKFGDFWGVLERLRERHAPIQLAIRGPAPPLGGDLVFVDPVDPWRNAAAAVRGERLETFLRAARAFTAAPRLSFFWPRPVRAAPRETLRLGLGHRGVFGLQTPTPRVREEAVLPHLRRWAEKISRRLRDEGFRIARTVIEPSAARTWILVWEHEPLRLPAHGRHRGPPASDPEHSKRFLKKWQGHPDAVDLPQPVDGRWQVTVRRQRRTPMELLGPDLARLADGVELTPADRRRIRLGGAEDLLRRPGARLALTKLLLPRDPWDDAGKRAA